MTDKDFPPLSVTCVRNLHDKLYDKRKISALEIEKMVKEFMTNGNYEDIEKIISILGENFAVSSNCHSRKGGLIGLAAVTIALTKASSHYCSSLIVPVIRCLSDNDARVRYYACESLYNIVKVTKDDSLQFFNDIFDALSKCAADVDPSVRKGSSQLDRIMKDIVMESAAFDLAGFIPMLRERIYTNNSFARQFIVSWVSTLDAVPDINMTVVLPDIIDGLFQILGDPNEEIRQRCEMLLEELLNGIEKSPGEVNYAAMVNVLIVQCQSTAGESDTCLTQLTAITWLHKFILQAQEAMLPYASGIIGAVLPCFVYKDDQKRDVMQGAVKVNQALTELVKQENSEVFDVVTQLSTQDVKENDRPGLNLSRTLEVLCRLAAHTCEQTRLASLRWMDTLITKRPKQFFTHTEELFPLLLMILSDQSTSVVHWSLELICKLSSDPAGLQVLAHVPTDVLRVPEEVRSVLPADTNPYLLRFIVDLVRLFDTDQKMLDDRGELIVSDLCLLLGAESIYRIMAEIVIRLDDQRSAFTLVQALNRILLTQSALQDFRMRLKQLDSQESCFLFCCLYRAWCHNPVALLSLCLLTQNYEHSSVLIKYFGELEITVETLTEIDQLIQLIESPIFAYLRLHLLDNRYSPSLQETLYCLLMLLPQTEAFHVLRRRLDCIPKTPIQGHKVMLIECEPDRTLIGQHVDFDLLLGHFQSVQAARRKMRLTRAKDTRLELPKVLIANGLTSPAACRTPDFQQPYTQSSQ